MKKQNRGSAVQLRMKLDAQLKPVRKIALTTGARLHSIVRLTSSARPSGIIHTSPPKNAMSLPLRDEQLHTYAEYCSWPDQPRYELIDGLAYAMSGPVRRHQEVLGELFRQVANALHGKPCRPYIAPFDVRLPRANEADNRVDTVVQPDLMVVCDKTKLDERGCRGAPDWVVEVLSPSTASHDHILKRRLYERVGVREFWLVHPVDRIVTIYLLGVDGYGKPEVVDMKGLLPVGILPEIVVDWDLMPAEESLL